MTKQIMRRTLMLSMALVSVLATLGVSSAFATPKGEFAIFAACPVSNPALTGCFYSKTVGGEVKLGSAGVPLAVSQVIQGGLIENEETFAETFVNARSGYETLPKTAQKVPGGLAGFFKCPEISNIILRVSCELFFENGLTGVNATTELAGSPAPGIGINELNLLIRKGTALSLPVKVKLENPLLGSECYIGSGKSPITFNLTTGSTAEKGSSKPEEGAIGTVTTRDEGRIAVITGTKLVDNTFTVPGATGCGTAGLLDELINAKLGLPGKAGESNAELKATSEQAGANAVRESE